MREIAFIKQNKEKWLEIEQVISGKLKKNPDELSSMYINLINDLSYSQTYYSNSKTTIYLNYLSSQVFQKIYKTKRIEENRIWYLYKTEVPLLVFRYRKLLIFTFFLFFLFTIIGAFSTHYDESILHILLSEEYVNQTKENIKSGNPIKVYESGSNWGSAILITLNNLRVGIYMYVFGIFGGVGSLLILLENCTMLGGFQYFFHQQGVLIDSMRGIWLHGTFEIFAMVIESFSGLVLGASVLFPKTYSRLDSLKIGFKDSFKIFISTVPFTIIAGIIEGFVTRHGLRMHWIFNILIIGICLATVVFYYLIYPKFLYIKNINNHKKSI